MKRLLLLAICAWTAFSAVATADEKLVVGFKNTVQADAELDAFVADLRRAIMSAKAPDYTVLDTFFAPRVDVFQRGLDPLQPWKPAEPITQSPLTRLADILVEQEPLPEGQPVPDYRDDALRVVLGIIGPKAPFGSMKEVPGAVCTPAEYDFDRRAALAFARKFELDTYSLRFFDQIVYLLAAPGAKKGNYISANELVMFNHDPLAPPGWSRYETADGISGYTGERDDMHVLAQNHLCFAKVKGEYRITAVFGYGS